MKKIFILSAVLMLSLSLPIIAQVPNAGFETWANGSPANWFTNNIPTLMTPVTQSSSAHSGSLAAKGEVVSFMNALVSPMLSSAIGANGFQIAQRYATLSGYYKLAASGGDRLGVNCILYKGSQPVAGGAVELSAVSNYTQFSIPMEYFDVSVPDKCMIQVVIIGPTNNGDIHAGSYFLVDDFALSGTATSVSGEESLPYEFSLKQNYPNPFNPSTTISYSIPKEAHVELKVFDILGREVSTLVNELKNAGGHKVQFDGSSLLSGIYIYRIKTGEYINVQKMLLLK